jgi:hypothetical protein
MAMRLIATMVLVALLGLQATAIHAQALDKPDPAVRAWLPGCRAFLEHPESMGPDGLGQCAGAVDALLYIGELLPPDYRYCVPLRTARREIISAIVEDVEALSPEVDRQDFKGVVLAILRFRWPCREG